MKIKSQIQRILEELYYHYNLIKKDDTRFSNKQLDYIYSSYYYINSYYGLYTKDINIYIKFLEGNGKFFLNELQKKPEFSFREKRKYQKNNNNKKKKKSKIKKIGFQRNNKNKRTYYGYDTRWSKKHFKRSLRHDMKISLKKIDWSKYEKIYYTELDNGSHEAYYCDNEWDNFQEKDRKKYVDPNNWY